MSAGVYRDEPGKVASGVMAVVVHVLFFALLVWGVSWQRREPPVVAVELWNSLPPAPAVKAPEPAPAPKAEAKPPPPPPEPKPVEKIVPKPAPEPKPVAKPDIALEKEKQERARREREQREKAEAKKHEEAKAEAKKREEIAKAEARKKEEAEKKRIAALDAERAAKEAERARLEREQQEAMQKLQQQQAAALASARAKYIGEIRAKIRRYIVMPPDIPGNPQVEFDVVVLPTGDVLGLKMRRSSNYAAYDSAVERAIMRAQPLPVPTDPNLFREFRELNLEFRPKE